MILSSTTRFIIQASNTGKYAKLMGNGRSYRLPGRNIVTTDLRRGNPQASEAATLAMVSTVADSAIRCVPHAVASDRRVMCAALHQSMARALSNGEAR